MITKKPRKDRVRAGPGFLLKKKIKFPNVIGFLKTQIMGGSNSRAH
jgi:hypothetical protein